jgi:glucose/arabinose dehydrogenase
VSPHYAEDGWIYVFYSTQSDNRIARLHLGQPPQPILTGIPIDTTNSARFHQGGRLAFGPDGMLYAGTGETYVTREIAQDPHSLGGKILRVTPEGKPAPGNPDPNSPVYSVGHRNVQGLAWDSRGRLFATELGEDRFDELNLIQPGHNYGWPIVEGTASDSRFDNPIATWRTEDASPSGLAIVNDRAYVACLAGQRIYSLNLDGTDIQAFLVGTYGRIRTVAPAPDGSLWIMTSNRDGRAAPPDGPGQPAPNDDRILRMRL